VLKPDSYRPKSFDWTERVTPTDFHARMAAADLAVTHAGIGTIVTALTLATPVLMMPRRAALGEHVNDHQLETIKHFSDRPGVALAIGAEALAPALDALLGGSEPVPILGQDTQDSLIAAIRAVIQS
jgi:UDP-N-acetylglucosamine transferase subunit ALG13